MGKRAQFGPYRFWGKLDPTERKKPPIVAELGEPKIDGQTATLRLYDPIDSWGGFWGVSASEFLEALDSLPPSVTGINLHINSPGGEVYEATAIMNGLRRHPATVTSVVDGLAASAASVVAVGGSARVVMGEATEMMIHDAWGITIGPAEDHHFMGGRLDALSNTIAGVYAAKAGGQLDEWRALMLAETWYGAQEAVDAGLADEVEQLPAAGEEQPADRFDLSGFKHAGRAEAGPPRQPDLAASFAQQAALRRARMDARRAARHAARALALTG